MWVCGLMVAIGCAVSGCGPRPGEIGGRVVAVDAPEERVVTDVASLNGAVMSLAAGVQVTIVGQIGYDMEDAFYLSVEGTLPVRITGGAVHPGENYTALELEVRGTVPGPLESLAVAAGREFDANLTLSGEARVLVYSDRSVAYAVTITALDEEIGAVNAESIATSAVSRASVPEGTDWLVMVDSSRLDSAVACVTDCGASIVDRSPSGLLHVVVDHEGRYSCVNQCAGVMAVEANDAFELAVRPNDPMFSMQPNLQTMRMEEAWDVSVGCDDVVVAVIDSGVRFDHPDLMGRLLSGYDFVSDVAGSLDGDRRDGDATDPGDRPSSDGGTYHGTHISGIIAASTNNGIGVSGITWRTRILPVRAFGLAGLAANFDLVEAVRYAAGLENASGVLPERRADVINLSIARRPDQPEPVCLRMAIEDATAAGVVVVGSVGNNASSIPNFPSAFADVIAVGAIDGSENITDYTNFGPWVDLVAPGGDVDSDLDADGENDGIVSTFATGREESGTLALGYGRVEGTSFAAAHVSGVAALVLGECPELTPSQVRSVLLDSARDIGDFGEDDLFGTGIVDASVAVRRAAAECASGHPLVSVSETVVLLTDENARGEVAIGNDGEGVVRVDQVSVDADWLTVATTGGAADTTIGRIALTADVRGLADGVYRATVDVETANADGEHVDVVLNVGDPAPLAETVIIQLRSIGDGSEIARVEIDLRGGGDYTFAMVPPGRYMLVAGTDRDGDGVICEHDDVCGVGRNGLMPRVVAVRDGDVITGRGVVLTGAFVP